MNETTIYYDNSSWNLLAEDGRSETRELLIKSKIVTCYSIENLLEMLSTSNTRKLESLESTLNELPSRFIARENGAAPGHTYKAGYYELNAEQRWERYYQAKLMSPIGTFGLTDLLQKMIGGIQSKTNNDIMNEALKNMRVMLEDAADGIEDEYIKKFIAIMKEKILTTARSASSSLVDQMDETEKLILPKLNSVHINNFTGPRTVERIFEEALKSEYEGITDFVDGFSAHIPKNRGEARKCNADYDMIVNLAQLLFFLGYKREAKNTRDGDRARIDFQGSITDFYHIANSSVCSVFHTCDKAQAHIAAAIFDHFDVKTMVILHQGNNMKPVTLYIPNYISVMHQN